MCRKLVIIGGVAGGATAAARARRLSEDAEIVVIERGPDVSFANCGLPYHIGGEIARRQALLVQTKLGLESRFNLDIRTRHEALAIDRAKRTVRVRDLETGREFDESYETLLLAPGAAPIRPNLPGIDHPAVYTLRNMADMDRIKKAVEAGGRDAVVIGGGFIGLEMAENLQRRDMNVTVVEMLPQVMPPLDPEVAEPVHQTLRRNGVNLRLKTSAQSFSDIDGRVRVTLDSGETLDVDFAVLSVGVRPDSHLATDAGLDVGERGAIVVDQHMCTSDPQIYAVGDAVAVHDPILEGPTLIPLAGPANRQARIAVDNIFGRNATYRGTLGTSIVRVFDVVAAATGASEKQLRRHNREFRKIYVHRGNHVGYFPGAEELMIKLLFAPEDGRILGGQIVGGAGVDKRIDVLALALQAGFTVADLEQAELAYAPQFGAAKDPLNIAAFVANNGLQGDEGVRLRRRFTARGGGGGGGGATMAGRFSTCARRRSLRWATCRVRS